MLPDQFCPRRSITCFTHNLQSKGAQAGLSGLRQAARAGDESTSKKIGPDGLWPDDRSMREEDMQKSNPLGFPERLQHCRINEFFLTSYPRFHRRLEDSVLPVRQHVPQKPEEELPKVFS